MSDTTLPPIVPPGSNVPTVMPASDAPVAASSGANQNPLDVLDQILNDAQNRADEAAETREQEEARKIQESLARQKEEDAKNLAAEIAKLQTVKQSPEYLAKVEQQQDADQAEADQAEKLEGMEIVQLGHTKI